jgi:hypothetical protein
MRLGRSTASAVAVGAVSLLVAACGGSAAGTHHVRRRPAKRTTTVAQPTATTPTTSTGPLTNTVATGPATTPTGLTNPCVAADLTPSLLGTNGAAGTLVLGIALKNTGTKACQTYGWPGVEFLSSSGAALPTNATRTTADVVGATPANLLTLTPGEEASFRIVSSDVAPGGGSCPIASALQIYAPNDTTTMKVALPGVAACGSATLSPMLPGTSAFAGQGGSGGQTGATGAPTTSTAQTTTSGGNGV